MQTLGSPASLVASIREEADAELERIQETTAAELAAIAAPDMRAGIAVADRDERLAAARRANEDRIARQEWDGRRASIEQREQWIQDVVTRAQERWASAERRESLNALIREARSRLPDGIAEVAVNARDLGLVDAGDARVTTAPIAGGCVVTVGDVSFDNSFEARSRRLETEWRSALSGMYR